MDTHERQNTISYSAGIKIESSMCLSRCRVSPVKTGKNMDFSGHFEDALARVLGQVPGLVQNSSLGTHVLRGLVQLSSLLGWSF